jgi:CTP synthase (UTP-ammonia lyase)
MIITKQNHRYITQSISSVTSTPEHEIAWGADTNENLVIFTPDGVDISAVEAELVNSKIAADLVEIRQKRNEKLSETDWWVMPDRTATDEQIAYRQALRDITDTYTSIEEVVWPEKPE